MKRNLGAALAALLLLSPTVFAQSSADPRLVSIDAKASFRDTDFTAVYTVVQSKPGEGEAVTMLRMYRRDGAEKFVLEILKPDADKGRGIYREGNVIKKYNPLEKRFDVTTGKDQLRNSNIRLSDFMGATFARDYTVASAESGTVGTTKVSILTLKSSIDTVTFPEVRLWVSSDNLILRRADFSLSGQLLRTAVTKYATLGSRSYPTTIVIQDELRGQKVNGVLQKERTVVTIAEPAFGPQGDLTFSQAFLEGKAR